MALALAAFLSVLVLPFQLAAAQSVCEFTWEAPAAQPPRRVRLVLQEFPWRRWERMCAVLSETLQPLAEFAPDERTLWSQDILAATGYFDDIKCSIKDDWFLACSMRPMPVVRSIDVGGDIPWAVLTNDVRRRVFLRPGTILDAPVAQSASQRRRLQEAFAQWGYFGTQATVAFEEIGGAAPNLGMQVRVDVSGVQPTQLGEVSVLGTPVLTVDEIDSALRHRGFLWLYERRFQPRVFEEDLQALTTRLQDAGFPAARVRGDFEPSPAAGRTNVQVVLDSGPRLRMRFVGNRELSARQLSRVATFEDAAAVDTVEFENSAVAIRRLYQERGYFAVQVQYEAEESPELVELTYFIDEGPKAHIKTVHFTGNEHFDAKAITREAEMLLRESGIIFRNYWVDEYAQRDRRAIARIYAEAGFSNTIVSARYQLVTDGALEVHISIDEGDRQIVREVRFEGLPAAVNDAELIERLRLRRDAPFFQGHLAADRRVVLSTLANLGYLFGDAEQQVVAQPDEATVKIVYRVQAGQQALFGGYLVRGNFRTRRSVFDHEIALAVGDELNLTVLGEARRRLRMLGVFGNVELSPLPRPPEAQDTWLLITVEERGRWSLDAVLGFATDEFFSVGADFSDRNFLGRAVGMDLSVRWGNATGLVAPWLRIGNSDRATLRWRAPRPFGLPFDAESNGFYEYFESQPRLFGWQDTVPLFVEQRFGGNIAASRQLAERGACFLCPAVAGRLGYELVSSQFELNVEDTPLFIDPVAREDRLFGRFFVETHADRRDSTMDPKRGYAASARLELALNALVPWTREASSFWRGIFSLQAYWLISNTIDQPMGEAVRFGGPLVLAGGASFNTAHSLEDQATVPLTETFAYGGDQSVRGLSFRASTAAFPGATQAVVATFELRWYILRNLGFGDVQLAGFTDVGTAAYTARDLFAETYITAGPALRYVTPVGPVSLAYGWPVLRAPAMVAALPEDDAQGRFHFTLGYTF